MSTTTISALPNITVPARTDVIPIVHAGVTSNITFQSLIAAFGSPGQFAAAELPGGVINGSNLNFSVTYSPIAGSFTLYLNGIYLRPAIDYTLIANSITLIIGGTSSLAFAPSGNDWLATGPYFH